MRISALVAMLALAGFSVSGLRAEDKPVRGAVESVKEGVKNAADSTKEAVRDTVKDVEKPSEKPVIDFNFLNKAAECCQAESRIGDIAKDKTENETVKAFAVKLHKEHSTIKQDLTKWTESRKIAVVAGTSKTTKAEIDRLTALKGADFDRAFVDYTVTSHEKLVAAYEYQQKNGKEKDLVNFAADHLPLIKSLLEEAKKVQTSINTRK